MRGVAFLVAVPLAALGVAGCYGSTEPATDLRPNGATFEARGTANNGPAYSFFEYWPTASPNDRRRTNEREWPAGASGPFTEKVPDVRVSGGTAFPLRYGTQYTFRLCGGDIRADGTQSAPVCAQTRTFTTPVGDSVSGAFGNFEPLAGAFVDASSGPGGQNPEGDVRAIGVEGNQGQPGEFNGRVTCLRVDGGRAAVGAVGEFRSEPGYTFERSPRTVLLTFVDAATEEEKTAAYSEVRNSSSPPNCATASFANQRQFDVMYFALQDAP